MDADRKLQNKLGALAGYVYPTLKKPFFRDSILRRTDGRLRNEKESMMVGAITAPTVPSAEPLHASGVVELQYHMGQAPQKKEREKKSFAL